MIHFSRNTGGIRRLMGPPLLVLMLLASIPGVWGQETMRLGPKDAVELAVRNNLSLESARIALDTKKRQSDLVWNLFLPTVTATGTLVGDNYKSSASATIPIPGTGTSATVRGISGELNPSFFVTDPIGLPRWHVMGNISASLNFSFALIAGIQSIQQDYQAGLLTLEKARLQMEREVRKTYNQILLLEANTKILSDSYENADRQAAIAEANYQAGLAPRLSMLQAQVAVENMKPSISELENSLKALKASFAMTLGLPLDTIFILEEISNDNLLIPLDVAELISRAASGKPDILELQASITTLQKGRKARALQLYTPFLNFSWNLSSTFIQNPWKDTWFDKDNWKGGGNFAVTLGLSLNSLFPFTQEGQALKDMDNNMRSLNIALAQTIQGTQIEVFNKVNSLEKTQTSTVAQQSALDLAELSYRLTEEAFRAGLQDNQAVLNANLALEQAKLQLLTQQFSYLNDLIDLEYAVGVPFGTLSSR